MTNAEILYTLSKHENPTSRQSKDVPVGYLITAALLALVGVFVISYLGVDLSGYGTTELIIFAVIAVVLMVYLMSLLSDYRGRAATALRHAAIWLGIIVTLAVGYTFRNDLSTAARRVAIETVPPGVGITFPVEETGRSAVRIRRQMDGHFSARGKVNNASMNLLVDTGASTVVLNPRDAQKAGIDISTLNYTVAVNTANGTAFAAPIKLRSVTIGSIVINDIEALVTKPGALSSSLLGMSFLRRLQSYEFSGEFLTLKG